MMDYPRYSNSCISSLQSEANMNFGLNNSMDHMNMDHMSLNEYGAGLDMPGPSPGSSCMSDPHLPGHPSQGQLPKRRRTSNPQAEEKFQRALEAVRFGGIGFCKAARMFGVNNRTLWLEYKKKGYPNNRPSIKSRIKREHTSPMPDTKPELPPSEQMALLCQPHPMPVMNFIESRQMDFPSMQNVPHNSPLNLHGLNFNSMQ